MTHSGYAPERERSVDSRSDVARAAHTGLPRFPAGVFALALIAVTSRGLFEILVGKSLAYAVQAGAVVLLAVVLIARNRPRSTRRLRQMLALFWLMLLVTLLSVWATFDGTGLDAITVYAAVMLFFAAILVVFGGIEFSFAPSRAAGPTIVIVTAVMVATALLQQFGNLALFPGTDFGTLRTAARPSAMTGSFLHYPIALALLSCLLFGMFSATRRVLYLAAGLGAALAVLVSYSRSGMLLLLVAFACWVLLSRSLGRVVRAVVVVAALGVALLIAVPVDTYVERFLSIFNVEGAGNASRIEAWKTLFQLWFESPLLVGSHAGEYTNITSNLTASGAVASPESGLLQILVSLGALGVVAYYGLMLATAMAAPAQPPWFRAVLFAAMVQSLVYQSIEVVPYMAIFAMTPMIAAATRPLGAPSTAGQHPGLATGRPPRRRGPTTRGPRSG